MRPSPTLWVAAVALAAACGGHSAGQARGASSDSADSNGNLIDARCSLPTRPTVVREEGTAVLLVWEMPDDPRYQQSILPSDSAFLAYREAIRTDGGDPKRPIADQPTPASPAEAEIWRNERFNNELAQGGEVGSIQPVTCLDALFFAYQNAG